MVLGCSWPTSTMTPFRTFMFRTTRSQVTFSGINVTARSWREPWKPVLQPAKMVATRLAWESLQGTITAMGISTSSKPTSQRIYQTSIAIQATVFSKKLLSQWVWGSILFIWAGDVVSSTRIMTVGRISFTSMVMSILKWIA